MSGTPPAYVRARQHSLPGGRAWLSGLATKPTPTGHVLFGDASASRSWSSSLPSVYLEGLRGTGTEGQQLACRGLGRQGAELREISDLGFGSASRCCGKLISPEPALNFPNGWSYSVEGVQPGATSSTGVRERKSYQFAESSSLQRRDTVFHRGCQRPSAPASRLSSSPSAHGPTAPIVAAIVPPRHRAIYDFSWETQEHTASEPQVPDSMQRPLVRKSQVEHAEERSSWQYPGGDRWGETWALLMSTAQSHRFQWSQDSRPGCPGEQSLGLFALVTAVTGKGV